MASIAWAALEQIAATGSNPLWIPLAIGGGLIVVAAVLLLLRRRGKSDGADERVEGPDGE